jgi:hypothetical protein
MIASGVAVLATEVHAVFTQGQVPAVTSLSIESVATVFAGIALVWFGGSMLRMRDVVMRMDVKLNAEGGLIDTVAAMRREQRSLVRWAEKGGYVSRGDDPEFAHLDRAESEL